MKAEGCRFWRERIGALVLGQLDPDEQAATKAHLDGCSECRAEADALAPMAALLSRADPERLTPGPAPPPHLADRITRRIAAERRATRRRRVRLGLGAVVATAAVATAIAVILGGSSKSAPAETVAFRSVPKGVSMEASLQPRAWGSAVSVHVRGFRPGTLCKVWLRRPDGTHVSAGSFRYVYDGESDEARLGAAVAPDQVTAIGVRAGSKTFVAPLPSPSTSAGAGLGPTTAPKRAIS